ncbi:MAG: hypothetical protein WA364_28555 [Candidatus Nitrosopolaris sp.]
MYRRCQKESTRAITRPYNKTVKNEFLAVEDISSINDGKLRYEMFVKAYNETRAHGGINGLTPSEMFLQRLIKSDTYTKKKQGEKAKKEVSDEQLKKSNPIITSIEDSIKPIEEYFKAGFTRVYIHSTSPEEKEFIKVFCKKVLPYFHETQKNKK